MEIENPDKLEGVPQFPDVFDWLQKQSNALFLALSL